MISNVRGRVRNTPLPKSQALLPLFEAIINSIDAVEDIRSNISDGLIQVRILCQPSLPFSNQGDNESHGYTPIDGFEIVDNGIGFTDANFNAFNEADTQYKEQRGGKGVGRFIWLKAFQRVEIDSVFHKGADLLRRKFAFTLNSSDGISDHTITPAPKGESEQTKVKLLNLNSEYQNALPRNPLVIAYRIVEHCLEYFVWSRMPKISLVDSEGDTIDLDEVYEHLVDSTQRARVTIKGIDFEVTHFMLHYQPDLEHNINYCANQRLVTTKRASGRIANLPSSLSSPDKNGSYVYTGYVSSLP